MRPYEIRQLSESELEERIAELEEEIYNLRFQKAIRQASDTKRISTLRRDIARIYTILREHQLGIHSLDSVESRSVETSEESGEQA